MYKWFICKNNVFNEKVSSKNYWNVTFGTSDKELSVGAEIEICYVPGVTFQAGHHPLVSESLLRQLLSPFLRLFFMFGGCLVISYFGHLRSFVNRGACKRKTDDVYKLFQQCRMLKKINNLKFYFEFQTDLIFIFLTFLLTPKLLSWDCWVSTIRKIIWASH